MYDFLTEFIDTFDTEYVFHYPLIEGVSLPTKEVLVPTSWNDVDNIHQMAFDEKVFEKHPIVMIWTSGYVHYGNYSNFMWHWFTCPRNPQPFNIGE